MDIMDLFTIGVKGNKVYLSCDKDMLEDLCTATEALLKLGKIIKMKSHEARFNEEREVLKDVPIRRAEVKKKAADIYSIYERHLNNGCAGDKSSARQAAAKEIGIRCVDVKVFVQLHRQFCQERASA